jgi:Tol biopolymer transport system component
VSYPARVRAWGFLAPLVALGVLASSGAAQGPPALLVVSSDRVENSAGQIYVVEPLTLRKQNLSRGRRTWGDDDAFSARSVVAFTRAEHVCCRFNDSFRDVWFQDASGRQRNLTATPELNEAAPSVSPDGGTVAYYRNLPTPSGRADVRLFVHAVSGVPRELARLPSPAYEPPAWSPDGKTLLAAEEDPVGEGTVWLVPLTGAPRTIALPLALDAAWSRSGRVIVAGSQKQQGRLDLFVAGPDGSVLRRLTRTTLDERYPRPSPDGRKLAFLRQTRACRDCDPVFRVWVGGPDAQRARAVAGQAERAEWSPDGRFLAVAATKQYTLQPVFRRLALVDVAGGRVRRIPLGPRSHLTSGPRWHRGRVLFTSEGFARDDASLVDFGLWLVRADGVPVRRLTVGGDFGPSWSPDRRLLVFVRRGSLWTIRARGGGLRRLTRGGSDREPAWSPNGRTIAFVRNGHFSLLDLRTGTIRRLHGRLGGSEPSWSPDGKTIAFASRSGEQPDRATVWTIRANGTGLRRVTNGHGPSWSPDGKRLAFERVVQREGKNNFWVEVWTSDLAGGTPVKLADVQQAEDDGRTSWSPDGGTIAFHAAEEVYSVPAGGGPVRTLTNNPAYDGDPAWRP